jgi:16S rRNA (cytidine1402-2'-O)-methyltransferase
MAASAKLYLIPTFLDEQALQVLPAYLVDAVKECQVFFVENERSARRFLKRLWQDIVIDDYEWIGIDQAEPAQTGLLLQRLRQGKTVGILSEAGCPGIADPGQILVQAAQQANFQVRPLVGPSSILLALMASGLNGQHFQFHGYLPIDHQQRTKKIRDLEIESQRQQVTQLWIETPYRNNQLMEAILQTCKPQTRLCVAVDLTGPGESIRTKTIADWKTQIPQIHKRPAIFLIQAE